MQKRQGVPELVLPRQAMKTENNMRLLCFFTLKGDAFSLRDLFYSFIGKSLFGGHPQEDPEVLCQISNQKLPKHTLADHTPHQ